MKNKRNSVVLMLLALALVVGFFVVPVSTNAQTATASASDQANITALTNQLNSLLQQLIVLLTTQLQQLQAQLTARQGQQQAVTTPSATATSTTSTTATSTAATSTVAAVSNRPPRVNIFLPLDGTQVNAGESTQVSASAADDDGVISKIEFFANSSLIGTVTGNVPAAWTVNWSNIAAGDYSLTAKATDNRGASSTSPAVKLKVVTKPLTANPPTITITANTSTAGTASTTVITITPVVDSVGGWITQVVFRAAASSSASTSFATSSTSPFTASTVFPKIGQWTVSAVATNNVSDTTATASTTITITN